MHGLAPRHKLHLPWQVIASMDLRPHHQPCLSHALKQFCHGTTLLHPPMAGTLGCTFPAKPPVQTSAETCMMASYQPWATTLLLHGCCPSPPCRNRHFPLSEVAHCLAAALATMASDAVVADLMVATPGVVTALLQLVNTSNDGAFAGGHMRSAWQLQVSSGSCQVISAVTFLVEFSAV